MYVSATNIIMKEEGILEKYLPNGVNVEWSQIATGPDIRDAMISDKVDIADLSLMSFITAHEQELPISLLSFSGSTPIKLYSHSADIQELSDFKAEDRISITNKSTNLHIAFLALCERELGTAMALDSNLTAIPAADAVASLQTSDDYAGAVFSFPMSIQADDIDSLHLLYDMSDIIREYSIGDVMAVRSDYYEKNADVIEAFLKAQEEAITFIINDPSAAAADMAPYFGCGEEEIIDAIKEMPPDNKVAGYDKQAQLLYEAGILSSEPDKFESLDNYDDIVK